MIARAFTRSQTWTALPRINRRLVLVGLLLTGAYTTASIWGGWEPNVVEVLWVWFCQTACIYHVVELKEAVEGKLAVLNWPEADVVDHDVADASIRHHTFRWVAKSLFLLAGLISLYIPPRVNTEVDFLQTITAFCLVVGIVSLDFGTISDYSSRVWREAQLRILQARRAERRFRLENDSDAGPGTPRPLHPTDE